MKKHTQSRILGAVFAVLCAIAALGTFFIIRQRSSELPLPLSRIAVVSSVVDGDTVEVTYEGGTRERVRLIGVDTPEIDWETKADSECYAFEAKQFLTDTIKGKRVFLELDSSQGEYDAYERLLAYILLPQDERGRGNVNAMLLYEGYARELTVALPYAYQEEFLRAEADAEKEGRGMWSACE